ncbi:MAG TPA: DNA mismatch repair protein MutS [Syntrophomonas sp.]|nr:DNA mismatch repair protein MutS [Syntrophomonas sp.]
MSAEKLFLTRYNRYQKLEKRYAKSFDRISNLRFFIFLTGAGLTILCSFLGTPTQALSVFIFFLVVFLVLVHKHSKVEQELNTVRAMLEIQRRYLSRIDGTWVSFNDCGLEFVDGNHPYTYDLDIFGPKSLFQWISVAKTVLGRNHLKTLLADPTKNLNTIKMRQNAVRELTTKLEFCQKLECHGLLVDEVSRDTGGLISYAEESSSLSRVIRIVRFFPLVTILAFVLAISGWGLPVEVPIVLLTLQLLLYFAGYQKIASDLGRVYSFQKSLGVFRNMLLLIESEQFKDDYLSTLKSELYNQAEPASAGMKRLERISDAIDLRYNPIFYFIFNLFLFWDFHCAVYLERWKAQNGNRIRAWFETIGAFEALTSLSVISHIHPEWSFPELQNQGMKIVARDLGHPLIHPKKCVRNDIDIDNYSCIITGSNMSGKSTLLRTVGVNLVLAYAGAPVCAKEFHCTVFDIYTSMRVRDDLERNISSFYAELLRIKRMIEAAKKGEPVFFLLDEIFKGTNSRDRHTGARILIKLLSSEGAVGFVSTHDVELGDLEKEDSRIRNYHFREYYREGKLLFDYKLRKGVSNTRNAIYLMKMAGMDVPEEDA